MKLLHIVAAAGAAACIPPAYAQSPDDAALRAQFDIEEDDLFGATTSCRFRALPELTLVNDHEMRRTIATYRFEQTDADGRKGSLSIQSQRDERGGDQGSVKTEFGFFTHIRQSDRIFTDIKRGKVLRVAVTVDGAEVDVPLKLNTNGLLAQISREQHETLVRAIRAGKVAEVDLFDADGESSHHWTFDLTALRHVPRALELTNWRCG